MSKPEETGGHAEISKWSNNEHTSIGKVDMSITARIIGHANTSRWKSTYVQQHREVGMGTKAREG